MGGGKKKKQSQGRGGGQKGPSQKTAKSKGGGEATVGDLPDPVEDLVEDAEQLEVDEEGGIEEGGVHEPGPSMKPEGWPDCPYHSLSERQTLLL